MGDMASLSASAGADGGDYFTGLYLHEPHGVREAEDCTVWVAMKGRTRDDYDSGVGDTELYDAMMVENGSMPRYHYIRSVQKVQ